MLWDALAAKNFYAYEDLTLNIANRLLASVNQADFVVKGDKKINVTISIGVRCVNNLDEINVNALYAQADQALYRAKRQGKNQAIVFQERF